MYRLASVSDDVLQRVISNEIAAGFLRTFGVLKAVEHLKIDDFEKGILKYLLNTYSGNDALHDLSDIQLSEIGKKIERMYDELLDPEYEYTYDEFGEYLLHIFIEHARQNAFDVRESGYYDLDENTQENYSEVPMFASASLSIWDELYLREMFGGFYDLMAEEDDENNEASSDAEALKSLKAATGSPDQSSGAEEDEIEREEFIAELIKQASLFWCMSIDDTGDESFIFRNSDFLSYDEPGEAGAFTMEGAESFGSVMKEEDREPVSGSIKKKIGEEDD